MYENARHVQLRLQSLRITSPQILYCCFSAQPWLNDALSYLAVRISCTHDAASTHKTHLTFDRELVWRILKEICQKSLTHFWQPHLKCFKFLRVTFHHVFIVLSTKGRLNIESLDNSWRLADLAKSTDNAVREDRGGSTHQATSAVASDVPAFISLLTDTIKSLANN